MVKSSRLSRLQMVIILLTLLAIFLLACVAGYPLDVGTVNAETILAPAGTATPVQVHLEHGQELHVFCSADSKSDSPPNGILSMESTGADQWNMGCRPPGTAVDIAD